MAVVQSFTIDLLKPNYNYFRVVQQDSIRSINLYLYAGGATYNVASELGSGETLLTFVEYRRSDGVRRMYDTTSTGTPAVTQNATLNYLWTVALDADCFAVPGWTQINVRFETESGKRLHTFAIMAEVEATACSDSETADWNGLNSIADIRTGVSDATQRLDTVEADISEIDNTTGSLDDRLGTVELKTDSIEDRVDTIEGHMNRAETFVANIARDSGEDGTDYSIEPETNMETYLDEIRRQYDLIPRANPLNNHCILMSDGERPYWGKMLEVAFSRYYDNNDELVETCSQTYLDINNAFANNKMIRAIYTDTNEEQYQLQLTAFIRRSIPSGTFEAFIFSCDCISIDVEANELDSLRISCMINNSDEVQIMLSSDTK